MKAFSAHQALLCFHARSRPSALLTLYALHLLFALSSPPPPLPPPLPPDCTVNKQYINPIIQHSQHPLNSRFVYLVERLLKLAVPTLYIWLCLFFAFFHLW